MAIHAQTWGDIGHRNGLGICCHRLSIVDDGERYLVVRVVIWSEAEAAAAANGERSAIFGHGPNGSRSGPIVGVDHIGREIDGGAFVARLRSTVNRGGRRIVDAVDCDNYRRLVAAAEAVADRIVKTVGCGWFTAKDSDTPLRSYVYLSSALIWSRAPEASVI